MLRIGEARDGSLAARAITRQAGSAAPLTDAASEPHALYDVTKRITDVIVATALLLLATPVLLAACLLIVLTTRRGPLLIQRRVGWRGAEFGMLKLRTMHTEGAAHAGLASKQPDDARVTAIGRFLRRTSIDELPQLLNVIAGEMSLVGPRPGLPSEVADYRAPWLRRLAVKPGLSGLWQVSGRSALPVTRWMALDRLYVRRRSLLIDIAILLRTLPAVVTGRGAW
jgi:lipopolysaccharide/colanic/teichoic acid biosynthesis glycosyltransferase